MFLYDELDARIKNFYMRLAIIVPLLFLSTQLHAQEELRRLPLK